MLSTPGSRIRRLISQRGGHRRALSELEGGTPSDSDEGLDDVFRDRNKNSWYVMNSKKPTSRPTRSSSVHNVFGSLPPVPSLVPSLTPRSSASSLCSCDHNADLASRPFAPRRPCLCDASKKDNSQESLQSSTTTYEDDRFLPPVPPESHQDYSHNLLLKRSNESIVSDISTSDRKYLSPLSFEDRTRRSFEEPEVQQTVKEFSENIQKFIQEADEAFKVVGSTPTQIESERNTKSEETPRTTVVFEEEAPMSQSFTDRPGPTTPDISPILQSPLRQRPQPRLNISYGATPAVPIRSPTVSKRKKAKKSSPKSAAKPLRKAVVNKPAMKHTPRWTLTENMTELFSGRLFNKVEVDEMLTEAQLEEFKRRRRMSQFRHQLQELQQQQKKQEQTQEQLDNETPAASKSTSDDPEPTADTPIEPFHLEDLPSRIGSAGVNVSGEATKEERTGPTFFVADDDEHVERFELSSSDRDELFLGESPSSAPNDDATATRGYQPPSPRKSLRGLMAIRKQPPALPSIPEASSASTPGIRSDELFLDHDQQQQRNRQDSNGSGFLDDDEEYVYFRASQCTLAAPAYLHGPIRVAKSDLMPEPTLGGADDGLDWTAFQMAILGGAGDWNSESDDTIRRRTMEEIDDIIDWWDSFGFEASDIGSLQTEDPELAAQAKARAEAEAAAIAAPHQSPPSPTSTISGGEYYPDVSYNDIKQDNPYSAHHRWETLRRRAAVQGLGLPGPKTSEPYASIDSDLYADRHSSKIYAGPGIDVMAANMGLGTNNSGTRAIRESLASMPQSPMLDLRMIGGANGHDTAADDVDIDVVPMGYNLGHDLGDFLKWEAEHVYAGGYYSSQDVM